MRRRMWQCAQVQLWVAVVVVSLPGLIGCSEEDRDNERFPFEPPPPSSQVPGLPPGWFGGSVPTNEFELGRDLAIKRSGGASGYLRSRVPAPSAGGFGTMTQAIRADFFRGKRVRWSGYLRTQDVGGDGAGLWLRADAPTATLAFDNMDRRRAAGTSEWTYVEVVVDIPEEVIGLAFGALLVGPGSVWFDDLRMDVVGEDVAVTERLPAPIPISNPDAVVASYNRLGFGAVNLDFEGVVYPETQQASVDWLRTTSVSFVTEDADAPDDDLHPVRDMVGSARLIGLGEGTHGTREFFRMKHRLFAYLVRNLGFNQFSIEASLPEALAVDHYVQTGVGDVPTVVRGMHFWTWSTEEVYDLVRWMRAWNAAGRQPRVHFTGFDMQFPAVAMDSVQAFVSDVDGSLADSVRAAYACLTPYRSAGAAAYRALTTATKDACRAQLASVDSLFAQRLTDWSARFGGDRTTLAQRLARIVSQWEDHAQVTENEVFAARDRYMAENIAWWRQRLGSAGMVAWAHNGHVVKGAFSMGGHLARQFGTDYVNMGLTFSAGTFNAYGQNPNGGLTPLQAHSVTGPQPGSIEAVYQATGLTRAIIDARKTLTGGPAATALRRSLSIRSIGALYASTFQSQASLALPEDYDILIWFRNASASRLSLGFSASALRHPE